MRSLWWHSWTLSALAVAPVIDVIRRDPAFLLAYDFGPARLLLLLVATMVVAPLPLTLLAWRLRESPSPWATLVLAPPAFLIGLYVGGRFGLELGRLLPAAGLAGLVCWLYVRSEAWRRFVGLSALIALIAPLQLLLDGEVQRIAARGTAGDGGRSADSVRPPVVLLLLDELPTVSLLDTDGSIDRRRFPRLAELADTAHWFEDFRAVDPATERAVPALLSGRPLPVEALPIARDVPVNLFTLLAPHYRIAASESVSRLCPRDLNVVVREQRLLSDASWLIDTGVLAMHLWTPQPWAGRFLPALERDWQRFPERASRGGNASRRKAAGSRRRSDRVTKFRRALDVIEPTDTAQLHFVHLMLPHRPWIYLPEGQGYLADGLREMKDFGRDRWPKHPAVATRAYQRHLLQAEFTDRLVGELIDRLRETELFDRAIVVVTADHGISFRPGDRVRKLSETNVEDLLRVPLLIKLPGQQEPVTHTAPRSALDLLPTLLDLAEVAVPEGLPGSDLLGDSEPTTTAAASGDGLRHRHAMFGELTDSTSLFRYGRFADWIGEPSANLPHHPEIRVALLGGGATLQAEPESPTLPAWVFGWITDADDLTGFGIAVALDGTVVATGEAQRIEGRNRFNVLLPPEALSVGEHNVEIALIEPGSDRAWRLTPAS